MLTPNWRHWFLLLVVFATDQPRSKAWKNANTLLVFDKNKILFLRYFFVFELIHRYFLSCLFFTTLTKQQLFTQRQLNVLMQQITYQTGNSSHLDSSKSFEKAFVILMFERQVIILSIVDGYAYWENRNDIRTYVNNIYVPHISINIF